MSFFMRLFRPRIELSASLGARIDRWRALAPLALRTPLDEARWVVMDTETTGLNARKDRLLAIGACAVHGRRLWVGDGFGVTLRQQQVSSRENILVHGIGPSAQTGGELPDEAMMTFFEYANVAPLVAFHAGFDRLMIERAARESLGVRPAQPWLDLALLAPALVPEARLANRPLDDWLAYFGLRVSSRHRAADDAFASAELFLILLARARARGLVSVGQLLAAGEPNQGFGPGQGAGGV